MKPNKTKAILIFFLTFFVISCSASKDELSFENIPDYPASAPVQSMKASGMAGGKMKQLNTTDPFDTVVEFYTKELKKYDPEILSVSGRLGRQASVNIKQEKKAISITIQELNKEKIVAITYTGMTTK